MDSCARCGTFARTWAYAPRLCDACLARLDGFWSPWLVVGFGVVATPLASGIVMALNFNRLGDQLRAVAWSLSGSGALFVFAGLSLVEAPVVVRGAVLVVPLALAWWDWAPRWKALSALGARPVSRLVTVVAGLVSLAFGVLLLRLALTLSGRI
jgi:hypothetical protein